MNSGRDTPKGWVSPFGHPRINDRSHLPAAFRSVPRPSSPSGAKASTERPCFAQHSGSRLREPRPTPARRTYPPRATNRTDRNTQTHRDTHSPRQPEHRLNGARGYPGTQHQILIHNDKHHRTNPNAPSRAGDGRVYPEDITRTVPGGSFASTRTGQETRISRFRTNTWRRSDSNRRPPACKAGALPLSYAPAAGRRAPGIQGAKRAPRCKPG